MNFIYYWLLNITTKFSKKAQRTQRMIELKDLKMALCELGVIPLCPLWLNNLPTINVIEPCFYFFKIKFYICNKIKVQVFIKNVVKLDK